MRFAALSTGAGVPAGDFAGAITAVHRRVCVISLVDENPLTLATPAIGRLPRGVTLDAPPEFTFQGLVARGSGVAARGGILRIGGGALSIDLRSAAPWRSRLDDLGLDGARQAVMQALETAHAALRQDGRGEALIRIAGARLAALASATRTLDAAAAGDVVSELVGLGEGVTPAGDDCLVGYFAGLWACAGRAAARLAFVAALRERLTRSPLPTGSISRVYLEAAFDGEVSERLFDLASVIATGSDDAAVRRAAGSALAVGHSSGACGLLGFLEACACWNCAAPADRRKRRHASPFGPGRKRLATLLAGRSR
jgi:hypothetical protein